MVKLNGNTTPIPNDILAALVTSKLGRTELAAVLALIRKTYGWNDNNGGRIKSAVISLDKWSIMLQVDKGRASRILTNLEKKHIINREYQGPGKSYSYSINSVDVWNNCHERQQLVETATVVLSQRATVVLSQTSTPVGTNSKLWKENEINIKEKESINNYLNKEKSSSNDTKTRQSTRLPKKYTPAPADPRLDAIVEAEYPADPKKYNHQKYNHLVKR